MAQEDVPSQIGRYQVDRLLGSGAMGFVYLGRDPELDRPVAVKTLRDLKLDEDARTHFLERFRNEARAAARLHHPNIVQVYDVGEDDELGPYLVFEYVAGKTLKQEIRGTGPLDPARIARLANEVGDALSLAHERGVIHRDIKPDNLLVTPEGSAKLADFGVARLPNAALTREGQFLGTPAYAAPETLERSVYGPQTDVFSFASVLFEAATGKRAFPGDDAVAVAHAVIHSTPASPRSVAEHPEHIPDAVEAALLRGLAKDPRDRFESAASLAHAIVEAYEDAGLVKREDVVRPASRRMRLPSDPPPSPAGGGWAIAAATLTLLLVGLGLTFYFLSREDPPPPILDAGTDVADAAVDAGADAGEVDAGTDAGSTAADGDDASVDEDASAAEEDAGEDAGEEDAGVDIEAMDPFEREEAAKDAIDAARAAYEAGDYRAAQRSLHEARRFDPTNPDIDELAGEVEAAAARAGTSGADDPPLP